MKINQIPHIGRRAISVLSLFLLICFCLSSLILPASAAPDHGETFRYAGLRLCPGGMPFGVKFITDGVLITNVDTSAAAVTQVWSYVAELIFNMLVLVGALKMSDRIIREMMGL